VKLAALTNEAAIRAVRRGGSVVTAADFTDAVKTANEVC
jgi:ATP-dependent Zn protease